MANYTHPSAHMPSQQQHTPTPCLTLLLDLGKSRVKQNSC